MALIPFTRTWVWVVIVASLFVVSATIGDRCETRADCGSNNGVGECCGTGISDGGRSERIMC